MTDNTSHLNDDRSVTDVIAISSTQVCTSSLDGRSDNPPAEYAISIIFATSMEKSPSSHMPSVVGLPRTLLTNCSSMNLHVV